MTEIAGLDTILGLVGEPPKKIPIPYDLMKYQELARQDWNTYHIAIIPYCFKCKEPLVWHHAPRGEEEEETIFHCPKCKRKWTRGKDFPGKIGGLDRKPE